MSHQDVIDLDAGVPDFYSRSCSTCTCSQISTSHHYHEKLTYFNKLDSVYYRPNVCGMCLW